MAKINDLLEKRLGTTSNTTKVQELARQSREGARTTFSGLFRIVELSTSEKTTLHELLAKYSNSDAPIQEDLNALVSLTAEVKAINTQAALLHGERIKRAQEILKRYQEGAFSTWLKSTYGNRQTPYNFLLYYEFYTQAPSDLRSKIEAIPRQIIYTLASRKTAPEKKYELVSQYKGETKEAMIEHIRDVLPLDNLDQRKSQPVSRIQKELANAFRLFQKHKNSFSEKEIKSIQDIVYAFLSFSKN